MEVSEEVAGLGLRLAELMARNGATFVSDKIRGYKASGRSEETISGLEELVTQLIADKAEVARIAQAYEAELVAQRLSPGDVDYVTKTVVPKIEQLIESSGGMDEATEKQFEGVKGLLSAETVNVLQLLGFNFRQAIGAPLTELVSKKILSSVDTNVELQLAIEKRQQLLMQLALDPEATERFRSFF
ncbi:hypothetical protein [Leucobacter manosquensis]|uniref:Uncharacterized protein n=1 Tax=Leucobacter manosquensis TaxID=2810611 RepID=A0ABS5M9F4_9MICO|nr:hypothetical protein [Leucobacter manosquensis]MBS3183286.1 hypothetical protein [Leucobacter manosquensis]